jgi:AAA15 family ATPase/GTPase
MLIEFTVQNYASFNSPQTLSMLASNSTQKNLNEKNIFKINKFGIDSLVKSAAIFGANASGKSNFINSLFILQSIILKSLAETDKLEAVVPFLLKKEVFDRPSEFEVSFIHKGNMYRYGISILKGKIDEEWLYWTKTSKENFLFQRIGQKIKINRRSFTEAKDFIKEKNGEFYLEKTRENVPFISVLSQFNGEKSRHVIEWFKKLHIVSGINEAGFKKFTISLLDQNSTFLSWALNILSSFQIQDINIVELNKEITATAFNDVISVKTRNKSKEVEIVKKVEGDEQEYKIPLALESQGTQKLLYLLGPIFHIIKTGEILLVDEFDNKFHSLLSQFILKLYHQENNSNSQLVITCHDTHLLTNELFRRDQIWFLDKDSKHQSELYSLLEYKEHYTRQDNSYRKDYLAGKYGAIPLFKSVDELEIALNG